MNILIFLFICSTNFRVTAIDIKGNNFFTDKSIKNIMLTRTKGLFHKGKFNQTIFNGDIKAIKNLYDYNGFLEAEITDSLVFDSIRKNVQIILNIVEGKQTIIKEIEFINNKLFSAEFLKNKIITKQSMPFDRRKFELDNYIITSVYDDFGYTDIQIQIEHNIKDYEAKIVYRINEGEKQFIEGVEIIGLNRTKMGTVVRELTLKPEDTFRYADVLKSRRNLTNLGIFSSIRTQTKAATKPNYKTVQFILSEKEPIIVNFRLGYGTRDYLRFGAGITHINIFGRAWTGKIEGKISFAEYRLNSEIILPRLITLPLQYRTGLFYQFKKEVGFKTRNIGLYNETRFNLLNGSFSTKHNIENIQTYFPVEQNDSIKNDWLNGIIFNWLRDKRDDPIFTNKGFFANLNLETSGIILPSEVNYIRPTMEFRFFKPFFPLVFALSFTTGVVQALALSSEVPIYKRFYCGGTTSVRGYSDWSIGPKDQSGNPIGGNLLFETSIEFRFTIYKTLGGVFFIDGGNVWKEVNNFDMHLRWAAGPGIRLHTPLGSLRLDYGIKIQPEQEEPSGSLHFAIGEAF